MSTVPPTDGPGGRILSLARRLDEIAGVRDLEPLRVEAELLRRSGEQLESSGLALEPLLRRCMRLVSDLLDKMEVPEAEAECWVVLADLHDQCQEPTDFRRRAVSCFNAAVPFYADHRSGSGRGGWRLTGRRRDERPRWHAELVLRAAFQLQYDGQPDKACLYAERASSLFTKAGYRDEAEESQRLAELARGTSAASAPAVVPARTRPAPVRTEPQVRTRPAVRTEPAPAVPTRTAASPVHDGQTVPPPHRSPVTRGSTGLLDVIRDLRPLPFEAAERDDDARRSRDGVLTPAGDRTRFEAARDLTQTALAQTQATRHEDALVVYAMAQSLWSGLPGSELLRAACSYGLSTTYSALNLPLEGAAAARTALTLVDAVPAARYYHDMCSVRVEDLYGIVADRYPVQEPAEAGAAPAEMLLELAEYTLRLTQAGDLGAGLERDVLESAITTARGARFELQPAASALPGARTRLARCDFVLGACTVLAVGYGYTLRHPVEADEAWAFLLRAGVLAEDGPDAEDLRTRCAAMTALMARLTPFADVARRSDLLRGSLDRFLAASQDLAKA